MAVMLFPRSTKTAPDAIRYPPSNGVHKSSFLAIIEACFGKILDHATIRQAHTTNTEGESKIHVWRLKIIDWDLPPEKEDIEPTLMISDKNCRFGVKMLFTLYDEFDIQQFSRKGIK